MGHLGLSLSLISLLLNPIQMFILQILLGQLPAAMHGTGYYRFCVVRSRNCCSHGVFEGGECSDISVKHTCAHAHVFSWWSVKSSSNGKWFLFWSTALGAVHHATHHSAHHAAHHAAGQAAHLITSTIRKQRGMNA